MTLLIALLSRDGGFRSSELCFGCLQTDNLHDAALLAQLDGQFRGAVGEGTVELNSCRGAGIGGHTEMRLADFICGDQRSEAAEDLECPAALCGACDLDQAGCDDVAAPINRPILRNLANAFDGSCLVLIGGRYCISAKKPEGCDQRQKSHHRDRTENHQKPFHVVSPFDWCVGERMTGVGGGRCEVVHRGRLGGRKSAERSRHNYLRWDDMAVLPPHIVAIEFWAILEVGTYTDNNAELSYRALNLDRTWITPDQRPANWV
jgi:hypothetical protein